MARVATDMCRAGVRAHRGGAHMTCRAIAPRVVMLVVARDAGANAVGRRRVGGLVTGAAQLAAMHVVPERHGA